MPQIKKYTTNAERQAAYNERRREAERVRQAAQRAEDLRRRAKVNDLHETAARVLYAFADSEAFKADSEGREIMRQIAWALERNIVVR